MSLLAVPGTQRPPVVLPPLTAQQRPANAQSCGAGDLDDAVKSTLRQGGLGRGKERRADRFGRHAARAEQGIRRVCRRPGAASALDDDIGKTIKGFHRLRLYQIAADNEALCLPVGVAHHVVAYTLVYAEM